MSVRRSTLVRGGIVAGLCLAPMGSGVAAGAAPSPVVVVRPAVREPTRPVQVIGHRFGVDSAVAVRLAGRVVARTTTDDHGVFHASFTVPWGTPSGQYVVAASQGSGGVRASTHLLVRVNWPQVGFDSRRSNYNYLESVIGTGTVGALHELWTSLLGTGSVEVLEDNGTLFAYSYHKVVAMEPATGTVLWSIEAHGDDAISGVVIANGTVYVSFLYAVVLAYNEATGQSEWNYNNGDESDERTGPPIVSGTTVFVPFHDSIGAVSTVTHQALWTTPLETTSLGLSMDNGVLYTTTYQHVYAIDPGTGAVLWSVPIQGSETGYGPVLDGKGSIYVATEDGSLLSLDATTGVTKWSTSFGGTGAEMSPPAIANGVAYALGPGPNDVLGHITLGAINTATGTVKWTTEMYFANSPISVANGVIYLSDDASQWAMLDAYDAASGAHLASYRLNTQGAPGASISAVNGALYVSATYLYAFAP